MFRIIITAIIVFINMAVKGQKCFEYHKDHCTLPKSIYPYTYNTGSVSYLFKSGSTREIPFELIGGKDYRIQICTDSVFNGVVQFQIIDDNGKELYNNSQNKYSLFVEFTNKTSRMVNLVLTAPKPIAGISDTIIVEGCIGLLIEDMVAPRTGF